MSQEQVEKACEWLYTLRDHDHAMALISEVDRLQTDRNEWRKVAEGYREEMGQLIAENERLKTCQSCGGQGYNVICDDPYGTQPCECVVFEQVLEDYPKLVKKVAKQDKEIQTLQEQFKKSYWFVKAYYMTYLLYRRKKEDISHNEQYFIYGNANSIIGEIEGKAPNGAKVEVESQYKS